ncbi:MAG: DUF3999 family protein [Phycisphaerae bacterium]|jgi:hypothetical protein
MTKSKILATIIIVLLFAFAGTVFAFEIAKWKYQAKVIIEDVNSKYCTLALTPEAYNAARPDLGDIRLVDANGEQVPYVLFKPQDTTEKQVYKPAVINRSTRKDKTAVITLDFSKQTIKNSIEVITQGDNFRRAVKIEGSNDNIEFFTLVEQAYTFAVEHDKRFEQIDLPANDYRYLRISVWPMTTEKKKPVIEEVKAFKIGKKFAKRQPVNIVQTEQSEDEKNKSSIYIYDLAYCRLLISEIELNVADDSFYRYVTVEGRDAATQRVEFDSEDNVQRFKEVEVPWRRIINDTIYRYTEINGLKREKLVLHIPATGYIYRYLKITIKNYDDRPVTLKSVSAEMMAHQVIFAVEDNAAPVFYVGSDSANPPQYDLEYKLSNPSQVEAGIARLSDITDNPVYAQAEEKPVAWTEKHKFLLSTILVIVVLVLAGFILKSFKSMQNEQVKN